MCYLNAKVLVAKGFCLRSSSEGNEPDDTITVYLSNQGGNLEGCKCSMSHYAVSVADMI